LLFCINSPIASPKDASDHRIRSAWILLLNPPFDRREQGTVVIRKLRIFHSLTVLKLLALLLSLLAMSCGQSRFKKVYPVKGRVLVDGKPAEGVTVGFHSLDDPGDELVRPWGKTDGDGWFTPSTYKKDDGLPAGSYAVTLIWLPKGYQGSIEVANKLPARYSEAETSQLKAQINAGRNELPPFELQKK
jgi:hypothetical protein